MKRIIAPSILSADFKVLGEQIKTCADNGAEFLHFDVMDGIFVPNISFGMPVLASIQGVADIVMDAHLMVTEPIRFIEAFQKAGADYVTVHYEACEDVQATLDKIHECGMKAGLSIKPATPVEALLPYIDQAEMFLIMSVEPGKGGQAFIPESLDKIRELRNMLNERGLDTHIQVDGGIYHANVGEVLDAGADIIVAGSAAFKGNVAENVSKFVEIFKDYE
ncbi:MAG: ribulose-phosphate 3-epimerase [Ruminococcus sp.]|nr:ribulose-phosphate 3-epimerase [Ruminococcus sp.]